MCWWSRTSSSAVRRDVRAHRESRDGRRIRPARRRWREDDAGRILEGRATLGDVGREIYDLVQRVGNGEPTKSAALGHQEFILTYKSFEPLGPSCLPV